jgi:hypothetical protein
MVCRTLTECEAEGEGELVRRFVWVMRDSRGRPAIRSSRGMIRRAIGDREVERERT